MLKLFSKKKTRTVANTPIDSHATITKLRQNIEIQEKREVHLRARMERLAAEAKEKLAKGDKRGAVYAMKKRKMHEQELAKIDNVKMTLETQAINLEGAAQNMETFNVMKTGNSTMKSIRKALGIDQVDELLEDVKDEMDRHNEVNDAFTQPIDPLFMADEAELMAELNALAGEDTKTSSFWPAAPLSRPTMNAEAAKPAKKSSFALFG